MLTVARRVVFTNSNSLRSMKYLLSSKSMTIETIEVKGDFKLVK